MTCIETLGLDYNKYSDILFYYLHLYILGGGGVQGQCKGQRLMNIFAVNDYNWWATSYSKVLEK